MYIVEKIGTFISLIFHLHVEGKGEGTLIKKEVEENDIESH